MKNLPVLLMIAIVSGAVISIAFAESWKFAVTDDSRAVAADSETAAAHPAASYGASEAPPH